MNLTAIIAAAGRGERFGGGDKLAQDLGGRPVLLRTVELFTKRREVRTIIVAGPAESNDFDSFRERFGAALGFHGVLLVPGGVRERWETVQRALRSVPDDATHVAVHDAARPVVPAALFDRVFAAAAQEDAVIPAVALSGTIKRVSAASERLKRLGEDLLADMILGDDAAANATVRAVEETVDRRALHEAQTPQVFRAALLRRAYAQADLDGVTDDAQVVERLGERVCVVEGDRRNIKITTPQDVPLAAALLAGGALRTAVTPDLLG